MSNTKSNSTQISEVQTQTKFKTALKIGFLSTRTYFIENLVFFSRTKFKHTQNIDRDFRKNFIIYSHMKTQPLTFDS